MRVNRRAPMFVVLAATVVAATAQCGGSSSPVTPPPGVVALSSITLSASSVVGGNPVTGTATLNVTAPGGGVFVSLSGAGAAPVTVPASVTVPPGSTSAPFTISTAAVGAVVSSTISGSYGGVSKSAVLSVTPPPVATASFGVTGPTVTETCQLRNDGGALNCTFNGSGSTAAPGGTITAWDWSYHVGMATPALASGQVVANPTFACSMLPPPPLPAGTQWFSMIVTLEIHDSLGNVADSTHNDVRLAPQGACGFQ